MNCKASAVMTTWTSALALTSKLAMSTALCAAMEPVTPRTICGLLIVRDARSVLPHFFRVDDAEHAAQILFDAGADHQVIEGLPMADLLARHAEPFLDDVWRIRAALLQTLLQNLHRRWREKDRDQ